MPAHRLPGPARQGRAPRHDQSASQVLLEVLCQLAGGRVAPVGVLLHRLERDRLQVERDPRVEATRWARVLGQDAAEDLLAIVAGERSPLRQHLVEHRAQRVDVGAMVQLDPSRGDLLR